MKFTRSIPRSRRLPSYSGRLMVDTVRGVLRVRKWPRKRGTPTSPAQLFWVDWFRQANLLAKYASAATLISAIALTKGSRWYPRDIILKAMRGRLITVTDVTGWRWYSMAAILDVSATLDILAQTVGGVLVRATDRWRAPPPGNLGDVLTNQGNGAPPIWQAAGGGGGVTQAELPESPILPDNTVTFYDIAVSNYVEVVVSLEVVKFNTSSTPQIRLSTDGGVTFKAGAADYYNFVLNQSLINSVNVSFWGLANAGATSGFDGDTRLTNLRAARAVYAGGQARPGVNGAYRAGHANFDGPITHIRFLNSAGVLIKSGTVRLVGLVSS